MTHAPEQPVPIIAEGLVLRTSPNPDHEAIALLHELLADAIRTLPHCVVEPSPTQWSPAAVTARDEATGKTIRRSATMIGPCADIIWTILEKTIHGRSASITVKLVDNSEWATTEQPTVDSMMLELRRLEHATRPADQRSREDRSSLSAQQIADLHARLVDTAAAGSHDGSDAYVIVATDAAGRIRATLQKPFQKNGHTGTDITASHIDCTHPWFDGCTPTAMLKASTKPMRRSHVDATIDVIIKSIIYQPMDPSRTDAIQRMRDTRDQAAGLLPALSDYARAFVSQR